MSIDLVEQHDVDNLGYLEEWRSSRGVWHALPATHTIKRVRHSSVRATLTPSWRPSRTMTRDRREVVRTILDKTVASRRVPGRGRAPGPRAPDSSQPTDRSSISTQAASRSELIQNAHDPSQRSRPGCR